MKKLFLLLLLLALCGGGFDLLAEESRLELRIFAASQAYSVSFDRYVTGTDTFDYQAGAAGVRIAGDRLSLSYIAGNGRLTSSSSDTTSDLNYSGECSASHGALEHSWYSDKPKARSQWTFTFGAGVLNLNCTNRNLETGEAFNFVAKNPVLGLELDYIFSGSFFLGVHSVFGLDPARVDYQDAKQAELYRTTYIGSFTILAGLVF